MSILTNTTKKRSAINPREMIIFSYPKVGKTELVTQLPGKYLILDFEKGTDFFNSEAINIDDYDKFIEVTTDLQQKKKLYDFLIIDTLTSLYSNIINHIAILDYNKAENKNLLVSSDITILGYGVGYTYKRGALRRTLDFFKKFCKCLIINGHVADRALGSMDNDLSIKDLDIEGKLKNIMALKTDAIGLLYRSAENTNTLSFKTSLGLINGSRTAHISGKDIIISKKLDDGKLETYWEKIFIKTTEQNGV
jgi:hypothetical protein